MQENPNIGIKLESLIDLSNKLSDTHNENLILNAILLSLMGKLKIVKACILQPDEYSKQLKVRISKGKTNIESIEYIDVADFYKLSDKKGIEQKLIEEGFLWLLPILNNNQLIALICLGKKFDNTDLTDDEKKYSKLVSMISSKAIQNSRNHNKLISAKNDLEKQNQLLTTFFEISRDFSVLLTRSQIIKMLSYRIMGQLMVSRFAIMQLNGNNQIDVLINRFNKNIDLDAISELFKIKAIHITDNSSWSEVALKELKELEAKICSPMLIQGETKGLMIIGKKMNNEEFSNENLQFIEALGNIAISALENDRLFHEELEKKKLESEMLLALDIQRNLLPKSLPEVKGFQLYGTSHPSRLVGGDYFDFIKTGDGKYLITIADVSGKGMPAALLMANVQAVLRVLAPLSISLKELINRLNTVVFQNTSSDKFVTLFCAYLDTNNKTIEYINAGHNPPIYIEKDTKISYLSEGGLILGITDNPFEYEVGRMNISNDSLIICYTDGVTEALNETNEEYGVERLQQLVRKNLKKNVKDLADLIISDVYEHSSGSIQDDLTLIIIRSQGARRPFILGRER